VVAVADVGSVGALVVLVLILTLDPIKVA
jgi:hypothetical protein